MEDSAPEEGRATTEGLTIRLPPGRKAVWRRRARRAGMSLNRYICYVVDHAEVRTVVVMKTRRRTKVTPGSA